MSAPSPYRLSRVEAEGWKAAREMAPSELTALDAAAIAALNPYAAAAERDRWSAGFNSARDAARGEPSQTTGHNAGHQ